MRYVTFVIIPPERGLTETDRRFESTPDVERKAIHHLNLLADGTAIFIFELAGDLDSIAAVLDESQEVIQHNISETRDNHHVYVHFEPNDIVSSLLSIPNEYEVVVDTPMVYTYRGGLRVTVIGDESVFRESMRAVPGDVRLKLEQLGPYKPDTDRLFSLLTERQQEIIQETVQQGYYDVPRQATHQDVADALGCSAGTVGEHLRKIEAKLISEITP